MNILFISNEYPPLTGFGGIATYSRYAAEGLAAMGHTVHVICRNTAEHDEPPRLQNGVTVHRVTVHPYPLPQKTCWYLFRRLCYKAIPQSLVRLAWAMTVVRTCRSLFSQGITFDIAEYPECGAEGYYRLPAGFCKATVARLHTPWMIIGEYDSLQEPFPDRWLQNHLERASTVRAAAVSAPSNAIAARLSHQWRLSKPVTVYPNPLPCNDYTVTTGGDWSYIGRIERRKGVHLLIKAYAAVCSRQKTPRLRLIGRPYGNLPCGRLYGDYIRSLIAEADIGEKIEWIEGVPHAEIPEYLKRSSAVFFPSLWENYPYSCLEAMAAGCAVAASRCGGFPEMISHNTTGLLVEAGDVDALAAAMERMLLENGLVARLGQEARAWVRTMVDQNIVCRRAESFYRSVLEGGGHGF